MNYSIILNKRLQIIYVDKNIEDIGIDASDLLQKSFIDLIDSSNKINKKPRVFLKYFDKKNKIEHLILVIDSKPYKFYNFTFEKIIILRNTYFNIRFSDYQIADELFKFIFENNENYLLLLNKDYKIIKVNNKIINEFKYQDFELIGKSILFLYQQRDRPKINRRLNENSIKQTEMFQIQMLTGDGTKISVETDIKETTLNSEKVFLVTCYNIKEKQKYESDLKIIEQKFINIFHSSDKAMSINDYSTGEVREVNKAFLDFFGFEQQEIINKSVIDLKIFSKRIWSNFKKEIITNGNIKNAHYEINVKNKKITISFEAYILKSKNITSLFFSFEEINDNKNDFALSEDENYLDFLSDISKDGYWDWNIKTGELKISKRLAEIFGFKMDKINLHFNSWLNAIHPNDKKNVLNNLNQYIQNKTSDFSSEYRILTKTGNYIRVLSNGKIFKRNKKGEPLRILGKLADITDNINRGIELSDKKEMHDIISIDNNKLNHKSYINGQLTTNKTRKSDYVFEEETAKELQQNAKFISIGKKAGSIVHDFNNVLQIIQLYNDLAHESIKNKINPDKCFDEVNSATIRGKKMINSILTVGDEQNGNMQLKDIKLVLEVALDFIKPIYPDTVIFDVDLERCGKVICNSREIQRCLIEVFNKVCNIINNKGVIKISLKLKEQNKTNLNYAEIIIDNTKDALNKNSNEVESIHRSRYKSLKINLDKKWELISDIINNHNGFIQIASELDWELKVKINLPIVYEQENIID